MGQGIEEARKIAPEHAALMENVRDQLVIAFARRLGGDVIMPAAELDATGGFVLLLSAAENNCLHFVVRKKQ